MKRTIIHIDEEKCDGCGLCIRACPEGALQLIDGKARLVSESFCDGLGACIGECPRGAITFETREADPFDAEAVKRNSAVGLHNAPGPTAEPAAACPSGGECPGSRFLQFLAEETRSASGGNRPPEEMSGHESAPPVSNLTHWPVQLHLVPVAAPIWQDADVLIAADCVAVACPDFHRRLLAGKRVIIACPKLDDSGGYVEKLAAIFSNNAVRSVTVAHMEVPCCFGLATLVRRALESAGKRLPFQVLEVDIRGGGVHVSPLATPAPSRDSATPAGAAISGA